VSHPRTRNVVRDGKDVFVVQTTGVRDVDACRCGVVRQESRVHVSSPSIIILEQHTKDKQTDECLHHEQTGIRVRSSFHRQLPLEVPDGIPYTEPDPKHPTGQCNRTEYPSVIKTSRTNHQSPDRNRWVETETPKAREKGSFHPFSFAFEPSKSS